MKINEIIVESRTQIDEGIMDTIKSKMSGVYQMARKKYPNFDEAFAVAKSHKAEIADIIEQLKAKGETGEVNKEDIVAAIMPLSKKVAGEVGGKDGINENKVTGAIAGAVTGAIISPAFWMIGTLISRIASDNPAPLDLLNTLYTSMAIVATLFAMMSDSQEEDKQKEAVDKHREERQKQYFAHLDINGAKTAQEKDDHRKLYKTYGYGPKRMSHVDMEKYEKQYRYSKPR